MAEASSLGQPRAQESHGYVSDDGSVNKHCEQEEEEETDEEDERSTDDERPEVDCGAHTLQLHTRQIRDLYRRTAKLQQLLHHTTAHPQICAAVGVNYSGSCDI